MSKPMPNRPQMRTWLAVPGAKPMSGSTQGAARSPRAVSPSITSGRRSISAPDSRAPAQAEQALRPDQQDQRHRREQHHLRIGRIDHGGEAQDLAGDDAAEDGAGKRADAADDDDDEGLD